MYSEYFDYSTHLVLDSSSKKSTQSDDESESSFSARYALSYSSWVVGGL